MMEPRFKTTELGESALDDWKSQGRIPAEAMNVYLIIIGARTPRTEQELISMFHDRIQDTRTTIRSAFEAGYIDYEERI